MPLRYVREYYSECIRIEHEQAYQEIVASSFPHIEKDAQRKILDKIFHNITTKEERQNFYDAQWELMKSQQQ